MGLLSNSFRVRPEKKKQFPPIPSWKPNTSIDHDMILERAKYYTNSKLQLAIFKYGTVMFFPTHVDDDIEQAAKSNLHNIYYSHPDFKPLTMDDGNYLIEYIQPGFTIVFKDELESNWDYIEKHQQGVCTDEVLINNKGQGNVFDRIGKICLFGRAKMFMDAQEPAVITVFDPIGK